MQITPHFAGIAHLWFVTLYPFEDGNGRIARAIADMVLARADGTSDCFSSMLFVLDDYGQAALNQEQRHNLLEILEDRHNLKAPLVVS